MWLFLALTCLIQQGTDSEKFENSRHLNPEEFMTISEIIQYWGYPSEEYEILTDDGYYLQANRIPYGMHPPRKSESRPVVLLVHGLLCEGRFWIINPPNSSMGFILADAGYDVWIINTRGTSWSRRHQNLSIDQEEYWNFSFHEMGIYDIPATVNFILQKTKQESLYFIGHSQGATLGLIAFSVMPELGKKIKLFTCLAPSYTLEGVKVPALIFLLLPEELTRLISGTKELCVLSKKLKALLAKACSYNGIDKLCLELIFFSVGRNENNLNKTRVDAYLGIFPDFTSVKTLNHWQQITQAETFQYFDYGRRNKAIYNMTTPPLYKIEDMTMPTAVWNGGKDKIVSTKEIDQLLPRIPQLVFHECIPEWQHMDFIWGLDLPKRLYPYLLALMQEYK